MNLEPSVELAYQIKNQSIRGKITFICNLPAYRSIFVIVKITVVVVEDRIVS